MSYFAMMGLFLLKHGLLAHVVDFGYSYSRSLCRRYWFLGIATHGFLELGVSYLLLVDWGWNSVRWVLAMELLALVVSSWVERRAPMRRLLRTHVACEVAVLVSFAISLAWLFCVGNK